MEKLLDGISKFRRQDFESHKELFSSLGGGQKPHTLFISCSDSRIDPNMITGTKPGELFIIRNIANIVPPYRISDEYLATTSAIEYAVLALGVENIVVCGHSNCGGCAASMKSEEEMAALPHTRKWLELIKPVTQKVLERFPEGEPEAREWYVEQGNVVEQLRHLMTFPYIKDRVEKGELVLSGWYYIIETGEIYVYDEGCGLFNCKN